MMAAPLRLFALLVFSLVLPAALGQGCCCGDECSEPPPPPVPSLSFIGLPADLHQPDDDVDPATAGLQVDVTVALDDDDASGYLEVVVTNDQGDGEVQAAFNDADRAVVRLTLATSADGVSNRLTARAQNDAGDTLSADAVVNGILGDEPPPPVSCTFLDPADGASLDVDESVGDAGFQGHARIQCQGGDPENAALFNLVNGGTLVVTTATVGQPGTVRSQEVDLAQGIADGFITFAGSGLQDVTATLIDTENVVGTPVTVQIQITVAGPPAPGCAILAPSDASILAIDANEEQAGFQLVVTVGCTGDGATVEQAALLQSGTVSVQAVAGAATVGGIVQLASSVGSVTLTVAGDGAYRIESRLDDPAEAFAAPLTDEITVTVDQFACDVQITAPNNGALFNLASVDASADPGFQTDVVVRAQNCVGDASVQVGDDAFSGPIANETATVRVTLPEGDSSITVVAETADPDSVSVRVDRTAPVFSTTSPEDGATYNQDDDVGGDPCDGITLPLAGSTDAVLAHYDLVCTNGTADQSAAGTLVINGGVFLTEMVDLALPACTLTVDMTDAAGNAGSVVIDFTVQSSVAVVDLELLGDDDPTDGYYRGAEDADPASAAVMDIAFNFTPTLTGGGTYLGRVELEQAGTVVETVDLQTVSDGVERGGNISLPFGTGDYVARAILTNNACGDGPAFNRFFGVDTDVPSLSWDSPAPGAALIVRDDRDSVADGLQYLAFLLVTGLVDGEIVNVSYGNGATQTSATCAASQSVCAASLTVDTGSWSATANVVDRAANVAAPATVSFTVDATPPTVSLIAMVDDTMPADGLLTAAENGGTPAVTNVRATFVPGTLEDGRTVSLSRSGGGPVLTAAAAGGVATFASVSLVEGSSTLTVSATDASGNPGTLAQGIVVDTIAPTLQLLSPAETLLTSFPQVFVFDTNAQDGQVVTLLDVTGAPVTLGTSPVAGGRALINVAMLSDGGHDLRATVTDAASNPTTLNFSMTVDANPPTLTISTPVNNTSFGAAEDAAAGTPGYQVRFVVDTAALEAGRSITLESARGTLGSAAATGNQTTLFATFTADATALAVTARASDAAGNIGSSAPVNVTVDVPGFDVFLDDPGTVGGDLVFAPANVIAGQGQVTVSVPDAPPAATTVVTLRINGAVADTADTALGTTVTLSFPVTENQQGTVEVTVADTVGSETGTTGVLDYVVDTVAPTVVFLDPAGATQTYNRADDISPNPGLTTTVQVQVSDCESGTLTISEGAATLGAASVDATGNATVDVTITDTTEHDSAQWVASCEDIALLGGSDGVTTTVDTIVPTTPILVTNVVNAREGRFSVSFTTPGDDGNVGTAAAMQLVASLSAIPDAAAAASVAGLGAVHASLGGLVDSTVVAGGAARTVTTPNLALDSTWHLAVRVVDNAGNTAVGTSSIAAASLGAITLHEDDGIDPIDAFGTAISSGDLDGDGNADVVVGAPGAGAVCALPGVACQGAAYVYFGPFDTTGAAAAQVSLLGPADKVSFGFSTAIVPDLDGDGADDLLVSSFEGDFSATSTQLYYGTRFTAGVTPDATFTSADWFGFALTGLGDINGDGLNDFGATAFATGGFIGVFGAAGFASGDIGTVAGFTLEAGAGDAPTVAAVGDPTGDGFDDFVLCRSNISLLLIRGRQTWPASIVLSGITGPDAVLRSDFTPPRQQLGFCNEVAASDAVIAIDSDHGVEVIEASAAGLAPVATFTDFIAPVESVDHSIAFGDVNGDGIADLFRFGASGTRAYFGPVQTHSGEHSSVHTYPVINGTASFGAAVVVDANGDGAGDLLLGDGATSELQILR